MKNKTKIIKAWAVKRKRSNKIDDDFLFQYNFELQDNIKRQRSLVICPTEFWAKKWKSKWRNNDVFDVIPVEIKILRNETQKNNIPDRQ